MLFQKIKFRARVSVDIPHLKVKRGDWVYGWLVNDFIIQDENPYNIDPKTIGQFTGLHDKNGKEIWEGDLVKYYHREWNTGGMGDEYRIAPVIFFSGAFHVPGNLNEAEVIGTIHQDSHLLCEKSDL